MGETLHGTLFGMGYGGKGANQAVMAAKMGGDVAMVTKLGRDIFGDNTLKNFQSWGVDARYVFSTDQAFSGVAPIAVDPDGHNAIIIVTGANDLLTPEEMKSARPVIASAQIVVCRGDSRRDYAGGAAYRPSRGSDHDFQPRTGALHPA